MKKVLTVYVDDDTRLDRFCGTFVLKKVDDPDKISVWIQNAELKTIEKEPYILKLPWKKEE